MRCLAITKGWTRCRNNTEPNKLFCHIHKGWWLGATIASIGFIVALCAGLSQIFDAQLPNPIATKIFTPTLSETLAPTMPAQTSTITVTYTSALTATRAPLPTLIGNLICSGNLLSEPLHVEETAFADEDWVDFSDQYILQGKDILRVTYNLHGLIAQEGELKNDSALVFNQPNWYGVSLANYGQNGLDGEQTVHIPLSEFLELPNQYQNIVGGRPLDLNEPVSSIRARFWHQDHFVVDIISVSVCSLP